MKIIPFPVKQRNQRRLSAAVSSMQHGLEKQKAAISEFREINEKLAEKMKKLENDLLEYKKTIGQINVRPLRKKSLQLSRMMSGYRENCAH